MSKELIKITDGEYHATVSNGSILLTPIDSHLSGTSQSTAKLAEGHNPNQLTEEQVGVADGWRLLSGIPIGVDKEFVECWSSSLARWEKPARKTAFHPTYTYRTKMPKGYFSDLYTVFRRDVVADLKRLEHAIAFGRPEDLVEQLLRKYENLGR